MRTNILTESEVSSDTVIELRLLLSSLPNMKDRTVPYPCLLDDGIGWFDTRPRKDDWMKKL